MEGVEIKSIIIIAIAVGISVSVMVVLNSGVFKSDCDIHKDQVFEMGKRFEQIRELQKEIPQGTDDFFKLDKEFEELTDKALETRNWYLVNCL
jgi:hypothetical protein